MQLSSLEKNFCLLVSLATILRCHQFGIHREVREVREEREGEREREREREDGNWQARRMEQFAPCSRWPQGTQFFLVLFAIFKHDHCHRCTQDRTVTTHAPTFLAGWAKEIAWTMTRFDFNCGFMKLSAVSWPLSWTKGQQNLSRCRGHGR